MTKEPKVDRILFNYLVLKLLRRHPGSSWYSLYLKINRLGLKITLATFYRLKNPLLKKRYIKLNNFTWFITSLGIKELLRLEGFIRIILTAETKGIKV